MERGKGKWWEEGSEREEEEDREGKTKSSPAN